MRGGATRDDVWTVAAIAVLAFIVADVAHEVIGHGVGFLLAGGRSCILTTTRLIEDQRLGDSRGRIFDLGGPAGNLVFAILPWLAQRLLGRPAHRLRLLLWLVMAFSLFWAFGYMLFCGIVARGDWYALVRGAEPSWLWRVMLFVAGLLLYMGSERIVSSELHWIIPMNGARWRSRVRRLVFISYLAEGLIACAGAIFDPRGRLEILSSGALSSFVAALGLLRTPQFFARSQDEPTASDRIMDRGILWIVAAVVVSLWFVGVLGRGVKVSLPPAFP